MARFSKAQYEVLTEAFGEALGEVRRRDSKLLDDVANGIARKIAAALKHDNQNFDIKQFMDGVESVAKLSELADKGIH